jgi:Fe-S-cluster containining protein
MKNGVKSLFFFNEMNEMSEKCEHSEWSEKYMNWYIIAVRLYSDSSQDSKEKYKNDPRSLIMNAIEESCEFFDGGDDIDYMNPYFCTADHKIQPEQCETVPEFIDYEASLNAIELEGLKIALDGRSEL